MRTELIAPYPPSDGASLFLIETDSMSLIGPNFDETHFKIMNDFKNGMVQSRVTLFVDTVSDFPIGNRYRLAA